MNGCYHPGAIASTAGIKAVIAFHRIPSVVAALLDDVDFFPRVLSYISSPQGTRCSIKTESPRITQAICVNFFPVSVAVSGKRIVRGNAVRLAIGRVVYVDAKNLAKQGAAILPVVLRITPGPSVSGGDIQVSVRSERQLTAVVVAVGLGNDRITTSLAGSAWLSFTDAVKRETTVRSGSDAV